MLHLEIPTQAQFASLAQVRAHACVSIYLPTTTFSQPADATRDASFSAIDTMPVDIEAVVRGTDDGAAGAITLATAPSKDNYGVTDAMAAQTLASGPPVLGVRRMTPT